MVAHHHIVKQNRKNKITLLDPYPLYTFSSVNQTAYTLAIMWFTIYYIYATCIITKTCNYQYCKFSQKET